MTIREFLTHVEAYQNREELENQRAAMIAANIMNALGVKPKVSIDRLLGNRRPAKMRGEQALEAKFESLWARVQKQRRDNREVSH